MKQSSISTIPKIKTIGQFPELTMETLVSSKNEILKIREKLEDHLRLQTENILSIANEPNAYEVKYDFQNSEATFKFEYRSDMEYTEQEMARQAVKQTGFKIIEEQLSAKTITFVTEISGTSVWTIETIENNQSLQECIEDNYEKLKIEYANLALAIKAELGRYVNSNRKMFLDRTEDKMSVYFSPSQDGKIRISVNIDAKNSNFEKAKEGIKKFLAKLGLSHTVTYSAGYGDDDHIFTFIVPIVEAFDKITFENEGEEESLWEDNNYEGLQF